MKKYVGIVLTSLLTLTSAAYAADWKMDKAGSKLEYIAIYEKAQAPGVFKDFDVKLTRFDPKKPAGAELNVTVNTSSVDMSSRDMDEAVKETEWFDISHFPQAAFRSKEIKQIEPGKYAASGKLKIKNVEKDVVVPFSWSDKGETATMQGELTLNRVNYNVGTGEWSSGDTVGLDVKVKFNVKLQKTK